MFASEAFASDHFRGSSSAVGLVGYREWQHFVVLTGDLDVVVNLNVVWTDKAPVGRVLLLVRQGGWSGDLEAVAADALDVRCGSVDAMFGDSALRFRDGAYEITARLRGGPSVDLRLRPASAPFVAHN